MSRNRRWMLLAFLASGSFVLARAAVAQSRTTTFQIDQVPRIGDSPKYTLTVSNLGWFSFDVPPSGVAVTAPDGTDMDFLGIFERNSFAELDALLFGDWTVTETPNTGPQRSYKIRVDPFTLNDVMAETPEITSPANGAIMPTDVLVKWRFPSGAVPSSVGSSYHDLTNLEVIGVETSVDGPLSRLFHTRLLGPGPGLLSLDVSTQTIFSDRPDVVERDPSLNGASITTNLWFSSHSLPISVQVVPEPAAGAILAATLIACASLCRLRRKQAR